MTTIVITLLCTVLGLLQKLQVVVAYWVHN